MSRLRLAATAAMLTCGLMLVGGTGVASAQDVARALTQVGRRSPAAEGSFKGTYTIERFVNSGRQALLRRHAQGQGPAARRSPRRTCGCPATRRQRAPATAAQRQPGPAAAAAAAAAGNACSILSLDLGPINLNLLGLVVRTNQIQLRIDAVQGPGNLLGNLLCGITGILNPRHGREHAARPARPDPERAARALAANRITGIRTTAPAGALWPAAGRRRLRGIPLLVQRGHLLRHPAHRAQAPRQLHRRDPQLRRGPGSRRSGDLLHRRPARDDGRLRPRGAAPAHARHGGAARRRRARSRALHPLPPGRRARAHRADAGCCRASRRSASSTACTSSATRPAPRASARPRACCSTRC